MLCLKEAGAAFSQGVNILGGPLGVCSPVYCVAGWSSWHTVAVEYAVFIAWEITTKTTECLEERINVCSFI